MNIRKTVTALGMAFLMMGAIGSGHGEKTVYAAEKPAYLKSVTYFGDEWPINYWGSEDENMSSNFAKIKEDGFNSIILVIPWREFQPENGKEEWNQTAFDKLHKVMSCAEEHGLWVTLRIGYSWDYYGPSELPSRFAGVTKKDSEDRAMWLRYSQAIYQAASAHENFHSGFITWEDFWNYVHNMGRNYTEEERITLAQECGYTEYLKAAHTLDEINQLYEKAFTSYEEIGIPDRKSPAAALFFEYYDQFLNEFLAETQTVFPGISMEVRVDGDPIYESEGNYYYSHRVTYPCTGAEYTALMYSVSMGQKNEYDRISAETALKSTNRTLSGLYALSGKKLYAEQLLYMDTTAEFAHNTQVLEDEVDDYIRGLAPVMQEYTMGYGLWVYRNYVNNCVYNGQFGLGFTGWGYGGNDKVLEIDGDHKAVLAKNGTVSQKLTGRLGHAEEIQVEFWAEPTAGAVSLEVSLGKQKKRVGVQKAGIIKLSFPWSGEYDLQIRTNRGVRLDDIRVYTYEQFGRIYGTHGEEQELADDFRILNSQLSVN
ncbi:MAG: beta-galactosidase [Lachnospiraceae bacterium]|nr:beta-galactosidase [Lachnospiraceae bacterium]